MRSRGRATVGTLLGTAAALALAASRAAAAVPHTVEPGETLSGIAATNGLSTESLAAWNGISADSLVVVGQTIQVPAIGEAPSTSTSTSTATSGGHTVVAGETLSSIAAANATTAQAIADANGISIYDPIIEGQTLSIPAATSSSGSIVDSSGISLSPVYCPCGTVYLRSDAAAAWDQMRQDSLDYYGQDIYPGGPLSGYRTYDQQAQLYQAYLDGTGAPADPPGTSSHELGTAVDVATPAMRSVVDSVGSQFGWGKIHGPTEWWHVDYLGGG